MTICGIGYDDPGQKETDDEMLLVGWIPEDIVDPTACGKFYFGSNGFTDLATGKASLSDFLIGEAVVPCQRCVDLVYNRLAQTGLEALNVEDPVFPVVSSQHPRVIVKILH